MNRSQPRDQQEPHAVHLHFSNIARGTSRVLGTWQAFAVAFALIAGWIIVGFFIGFSGTEFQLFINTITTIITFLMVFLIQNSQNRDTAAIHLKLDELIHATQNARNEIANVETLTEAEMQVLREKSGNDATKA